MSGTPWRDKDKLASAVSTYGTSRKVGEALGCNSTTITNWASRYGIPLDACNQHPRQVGKISLADNGINLDHLKKLLKKKKWSLLDLADTYDCAPKEITAALTELGNHHVLLDDEGGYSLSHTPVLAEAPHAIDFRKHKETEIALGFTADNHLGSKYERLDVLNSLYDRFAECGVKTVYQGGNIIDGECRFNTHDVYAHGIEDQVANLVQKWPQRKGVVTEFVTGDDHEGWYVQRDHIDIGKYIESEARASGRDDLVHLGYMERDIEYKQAKGSAIIRIIHAGGGSSYAHSYTAQKYVEMLQGGEKPKIVLVGHYHKFNYSYPREVHVIQGGTTMDQSPFMRKKKLQAMVGGVVLWIKQNNLGIFTSVKVEWLPYYDRRYYAYHW